MQLQLPHFDARNLHWRKKHHLQQMILEILDFKMQKNETRSYASPCTEPNSKCIKDPNIEGKYGRVYFNL